MCELWTDDKRKGEPESFSALLKDLQEPLSERMKDPEKKIMQSQLLLRDVVDTVWENVYEVCDTVWESI